MEKGSVMSDTVTVASEACGVEDVELTTDDARAMFDERAQRLLGMTGEDFLRSWREGAFDEGEERPEVAELIHLAPFAE
jgi:hypothetical protein